MTLDYTRRVAGLRRRLFGASILAIAGAALLQAQIPGRNVNMVSGDRWPQGDPYLQRQNEPSMAASTRNPLHLLAGSNDYRTVDLPGLQDGGETGDAWLGLYKSLDGGQRWTSTLLPGYPQDTSDAGIASPMKGYQAGADPVVRPGSNGLFYYAGLVFDRTGTFKKSRIFVARFIDNNNKEAGDPIHFLGAQSVASDSGETGNFLDKPWLAVDVPRSGAKTCQIQTPGVATQPISAGTAYVAYAVISGSGTDLRGTIMFSRSIDCGQTWSAPIQVSRPEDPVNQGATIAIDPITGAVYVAWRRFALDGNGQDAIMVAKSAGGGGFETPRTLREFYSGRSLGQLMKFLVGKRKTVTTTEAAPVPDAPLDAFDQKTAADTFRTNAYPTMAVDGGGRVYVAWTERGFRTNNNNAQAFDAGIVMSTSPNGSAWTTPFAIEPAAGPGHQLMPSLTFAGGKLMLIYYDLREDISGVFREFVDETSAATVANLRHTIDVRATQASPADVPQFAPSVQVSEYLQGSVANSTTVRQLQFNPPNLKLFQLGEVPFMGDYVDIAAAPAMVQDASGAWKYNTATTTAPVFHAVWTDNRDVKPPTDGNWANYTPPTGTQINSVFDPTKQVEPCSPGRAGMRNQNVYTSKITAGLLAGSPGNSKPLSTTIPRAFVVFAQNTTDLNKHFRFTITAQPPGGRASFTQLTSAPIVTQIDSFVPARSTVSKSIFATSSDPDAKVPVSITEISSSGVVVPQGLSSIVLLNPDISNPDISNPDISNPDISNPDISNAEVYNPDISNPDISNPDISNPDISNPDISNPDISNVVVLNPDISNPDISNPDISNPDISNPDISNPDISNPDISNGSLTDVTWTVTNNGNTTSNYTIDVLGSVPVPPGIKVQIIVYKTYTTPVSDGCTLKYTTHTVLVSNIVDPSVTPELFLEPGGTGRVTLRILDTNPTDGVVLNPLDATTPVEPTVRATAVNTEELGTPGAEEPEATPPSTSNTMLTVITQPTTAEVGGSLGTVMVQVMRTVNGVTNPLSGASVATGILTNPTGGNLDGQTVTLTNMDGYAVFTTLSIDRPGNGYQLSFTAAAAGALPVSSAIFSVSSPASDDPSQKVFVVTNTADSGVGSLRQAMMNANATPNVVGPDIIAFDIKTASPHVIAPQTALPDIGEPVILDATTQPGFNQATREPVVRVSGVLLPSSTIGFNFVGPGGSTIRGFSITGFGTPATADTTTAIRIASPGVTVHGNWIGIAPDGTVVGNQTGIWVTGGTADIGGASGVITRNVIGGGRVGILIAGGSNSRVRGNYIGLAPDGLTSASHTVAGISMFGAPTNTTIGGPRADGGFFAADSPANVIAGNNTGLLLQNSGASGPTNTSILGNVLGMGIDGVAVPNTNTSINVRSSPGTRIGQPGAGNVIGGNSVIGAPSIAVFVSALLPLTDNEIPVIQSNWIGLDPTGMLARPTANGISLLGRARIGGSSLAGEGNVIAGQGNPTASPTPTGSGIVVQPEGADSTISGNVIGLNAVGAALPNGFAGINVSGANGLTIGGTDPGQGNVISGNAFRGIHIGNGALGGATVPPSNLAIEGNKIGTDAGGALAGVGNGSAGIAIVAGTDITVGGHTPASANVIAGNALGPFGFPAGVNVISTGTQASILSNRIFANGGPGIDIGPVGVTPNDTGDVDTGANGHQNFPQVTGLGDGITGELEIFLNSAPGVYRIQVFTNTSCDPSGNGEGEQFLTQTFVTTNVDGFANVVVPMTLTPGQKLTATATDSAGNTSEFSACTTVAPSTVVVGPIGGDGGSPWSLSCPSSYVAVALQGRAGDDIDRTELICAPRADLFGTRVSAGAVGTFGGVDYGAALTCASGSYLSGVHGLFGTTGAGFVIDTIGAHCANPNGTVTTTTTVGVPFPVVNAAFSLVCPTGKKIIGIQGRSGLVLDQIQLVCQ